MGLLQARWLQAQVRNLDETTVSKHFAACSELVLGFRMSIIPFGLLATGQVVFDGCRKPSWSIHLFDTDNLWIRGIAFVSVDSDQ